MKKQNYNKVEANIRYREPYTNCYMHATFWGDQVLVDCCTCNQRVRCEYLALQNAAERRSWISTSVLPCPPTAVPSPTSPWWTLWPSTLMICTSSSRSGVDWAGHRPTWTTWALQGETSRINSQNWMWKCVSSALFNTIPNMFYLAFWMQLTRNGL